MPKCPDAHFSDVRLFGRRARGGHEPRRPELGPLRASLAAPRGRAQASHASADATRAGADRDFGLTEAHDINPSPNVVSLTLRAAPAALEILHGKTTPLAAYAGTLPGPLVRAKRGDR